MSTQILCAFFNWVCLWILLDRWYYLFCRQGNRFSEMLSILIKVTQWVLIPSLTDSDRYALSNIQCCPLRIHSRITRVLFLGASTSRKGGVESLFGEINWDQVGEASESQTEECGYIMGSKTGEAILIWKWPFLSCWSFPVPLTILHCF